MVSFSKNGESPAASAAGASECPSPVDEKQQPRGEAKRLRDSAARGVNAKRIRARKQLEADDGVDLCMSAVSTGCSSGGSLTKRVGSRLAPAEKYRRQARSDGHKHAGTHKNSESESTHSGTRAGVHRPRRGIVYLAHIPSGFNEPQMFRFFSQFGEVVGVELRRSKKTGQSKGYGYVGFELPEVAEIVAETMNNYMMFGRTLRCQVVASSRVPCRLFKNWRKKTRRFSTRIRAVQQHNKPDNALPTLRQVKRRLEKERKDAKRLIAFGLAHAAPTVTGAILDHISEQGTCASEEMYRVSDSVNSGRRDLNTFSHVVQGERKTTWTRKNAAKGRRQESLMNRPEDAGVVEATAG